AAMPTVAVTPTPVLPVTLSLTSVETSVVDAGVVVAVNLANNQQSTVTFAFDPTRDVEVHDARGVQWSERWAEYDCNPTFPSGATSRLVRALFAGEAANAAFWPLTITVSHIPGVQSATWKVAKNDTLPLAATQDAPAPLPPAPDDGPLNLAAVNA